MSGTTFTTRLATSTAAAIAKQARARRLTQKQLVCHALLAFGVPVAASDLEDRTPKRKPIRKANLR